VTVSGGGRAYSSLVKGVPSCWIGSEDIKAQSIELLRWPDGRAASGSSAAIANKSHGAHDYCHENSVSSTRNRVVMPTRKT